MSPAAVAASYLLAVLLGQTPAPANDNGIATLALGLKR